MFLKCDKNTEVFGKLLFLKLDSYGLSLNHHDIWLVCIVWNLPEKNYQKTNHHMICQCLLLLPQVADVQQLIPTSHDLDHLCQVWPYFIANHLAIGPVTSMCITAKSRIVYWLTAGRSHKDYWWDWRMFPIMVILMSCTGHPLNPMHPGSLINH